MVVVIEGTLFLTLSLIPFLRQLIHPNPELRSKSNMFGVHMSIYNIDRVKTPIKLLIYRIFNTAFLIVVNCIYDCFFIMFIIHVKSLFDIIRFINVLFYSIIKNEKY